MQTLRANKQVIQPYSLQQASLASGCLLIQTLEPILMLQNFKHMPVILKLLTAHGLMCLMLLVFSVIPNDSMSIDGKEVTYAQWWSSGAGVFASAVGLALPFSAWLILQKSTLARPVYLSSLVLTLVLPYLIFWENYGSAIAGAVLVMLVAGYLYRKQSVVAYFGSNPSFKRDALKRAP